ncbi:Lipid droplet-associated hydrolase [Cyberlindnera fabianii]|uniref:Lipid droplet-associated hydrolase n=1 Tax=Cyberlindnera fabianii TaxID=36022 RepID=A0A1V2L604_CYBFA|nr:Lipid droplet-associated hydrolase [Cyberlindnera fabianii]
MTLKPLTVTIPSRSLSAVNTTVFHVPSTTEKGPLLVFIPGNPGFINYYITYLDLLHADYPHFEILGISHAGFSSLHGPDEEIYTLQDQIEHKIHVIKHFIGGEEDREVLIFGHSVGCYILQRVIDALKAKYTMYGMITPTVVDIHRSKKGVMLSAITGMFESFYYYVGYAGSLVKSLPSNIRDTFIGLALKNAIPEAKDATSTLITEPGFIRQSLGLATEEMKTIRGDWQYQDHWFSRPGIWAFFAENDHWVRDDTRLQLVKIMEESGKNAVVDINGDFTHSFCVSKSKEFAELTSKRIRDITSS